MVDELEATYLNKKPIIRNFSKAKVNIVLKIADLKKDDEILDFGCGAGWLKNKLKNEGYNIKGYDTTSEHSDIENYVELSPNKIFVLDVFEHIPKEEILKIVRNFKKMNQNIELIIAITNENLISRKARKLLGKSERVSDHITTLNEILEILNSELTFVKKFNFLGVSYIAKFKNN